MSEVWPDVWHRGGAQPLRMGKRRVPTSRPRGRCTHKGRALRCLGKKGGKTRTGVWRRREHTVVPEHNASWELEEQLSLGQDAE